MTMKNNNTTTNQKLRVWWIPQVPCESFYIPVNTPEEGRKVLDILAAYDMFQLNNNIKPDFCNVGGLQYWDEEEQEWNDWYLETETDYYEDISSEISIPFISSSNINKSSFFSIIIYLRSL